MAVIVMTDDDDEDESYDDNGHNCKTLRWSITNTTSGSSLSCSFRWMISYNDDDDDYDDNDDDDDDNNDDNYDNNDDDNDDNDSDDDDLTHLTGGLLPPSPLDLEAQRGWTHEDACWQPH